MTKTIDPESVYLSLLGTRRPLLSGSSEICQTTWGKGGIAFRCFDCEKDDNCVVCAECYFRSEEKHGSHRVKLIRTQGGCCDCGDISSWDPLGCCDMHGPNSSKSITHENSSIHQNAIAAFSQIVEAMSPDDESAFLLALAFLTEAVNANNGILRNSILHCVSSEAVISAWVQIVLNSSSRPIRDALGSFFLFFVQLSGDFKITFSRVYLTMYPQIVSFGGGEDGNHFDLSGLSVQLFTIPAVCQELRANLLSVLLTTLAKLLATLKDPGTLKFGSRQIRPETELALWRVFHDLGYCLVHPFVCEELVNSDSLTDILLLECLLPLHQSNLQTIKHGEHVIYENLGWRTSFKIETLFVNTLSGLSAFCRKNEAQFFMNKLVALASTSFAVSSQAGEKASFHLPLIRFFASATSVMTTASFPMDSLRSMLTQCVRVLLLPTEIAADVWVRNGDAMRYQAAEYSSQLKWMDVAAVAVILTLLRSTMWSADLVQAFVLCMIDIPDDTWAPESGLGHRLAHLESLTASELVQFIDVWWQSLIRDVVVGGNGNPIDELRRKCVLTTFMELLVLVTSDNTVIDLVQLDADTQSLVEKCIVQQLAGQQLSYSAILAGLPAPLRQPERTVEAVVDRLTSRDPSAGTYKLTPQALLQFDMYHRVFPVSSSAFHAREEFVVKHTQLIGSPTVVVSSLCTSPGVLVRLLSALLRTRLAEHRVPGCLEEDTLGQLDTACGLALRVLETLRGCGALCGDKVEFARPPMGSKMELHSLVQRADLDGQVGIYFGQQQGRFCVSTQVEGRVLTKESNVLVLDPEADNILNLIDELAVTPRVAPLVLTTAKQLRARLAAPSQSTETVTSSPSREIATQRQNVLLQRMRAKQTRFNQNHSTPDEAVDMHSCFMCREPTGAPFVVVGYCSPGDAVARLSPPACAVSRAPYVSACMHTVHADCWSKQIEASTSRRIRGDYSLLHEGEVQCPVCRTVSNCAIPVESTLEANSLFGEQLLSLVRLSSGLWLPRTLVPWRPKILTPGNDALIEASFNELLLSIALTPSRILAPFSLTTVLVQSVRTITASHANEWYVWNRDPLAASTVDCARLFLEAGQFDLAEHILALRAVQLLNEPEARQKEELARLAVFIAWTMIAADYTHYTQAQVNRIGYLPEDAEAKLTVVEAVLGIAAWRSRIHAMATLVRMAPNVVAPHAIGGLVNFVTLDAVLTNVIKSTLNRSCLRCNTRPDDPAICLLCGTIVCLDADCCRQTPGGEGECTEHARVCGADQGVFFLPFASIVLAIAAPRNCIWEGPYEDSHGEPDSYLKRSCKLKLSQRRLDQMRLFYTRAAIPTEIVRQNEISGRYVPRPL